MRRHRGLFVIFHEEVGRDADGLVEVCAPIDNAARPGDAGASVRRELAHREAYVRVTKAGFEMPQILTAYETVERWARSNRRTITGPPREVYLPGVDPHAAAPDDVVCDVAFPVS